jgi:hypothetical protein
MRFHSWQEPCPEESRKDSPLVFIDYYQQAFLLLHTELAKHFPGLSEPHRIRNDFWRLVPPGRYGTLRARPILQAYISRVEREMSTTVSAASLAYWLHLYRRLSPGAAGDNCDPITVGHIRAIVEAAVQKYAQRTPCTRIGGSREVPLNRVLGGILMGADFSYERHLLEQDTDQLVLTKFSHHNFAEIYNLEKLAYEIWRAGATLRTIGKGASLIVQDSPCGFTDDRSEELRILLEQYDSRLRGLRASAIGVVFDRGPDSGAKGRVMLASYNLSREKWETIGETYRRVFEVELPGDFVPNFLWYPVNIGNFLRTHSSLGASFERKHGVSLDAVMTVVTSLLLQVLYSWVNTKGVSLLRYTQRAYEGPYRKEVVTDIVRSHLPSACVLLGIERPHGEDLDIESAIDYWTLKDLDRGQIDLAYPGPHHVLLPFGGDRVFIDYTWIHRRLLDLFVDVSISDQNFKGEALELAVGRERSTLPRRMCLARDGSKKQIDCAYASGSVLIIVECKAVGRSIAYERGDPQAISYRRDAVVERALSEVDDKARWLSANPAGKNYDVTSYSHILPIAVSPFVEFIPSLSPRYWIAENIPRVLTPNELEELLENDRVVGGAQNRIPIGKAQ